MKLFLQKLTCRQNCGGWHSCGWCNCWCSCRWCNCWSPSSDSCSWRCCSRRCYYCEFEFGLIILRFSIEFQLSLHWLGRIQQHRGLKNCTVVLRIAPAVVHEPFNPGFTKPIWLSLTVVLTQLTICKAAESKIQVEHGRVTLVAEILGKFEFQNFKQGQRLKFSYLLDQRLLL